MTGGAFENLPNELLLDIFVMGCELEEEDGRRQCFRQPKEFARLARQVCLHWKALVDHPTHTFFWIARLELSVVRMVPGNSHSGPSPAQQLTIFYRTLLTSQGCDLSIIFWGAIQVLGSPDRIYVTANRLVLYAMDMLTPYQNQITSIHLLGQDSDTCVYLLELLTSHWKDMPRLSEVTFPENYRVMTMPELVEQTSDFGYGSLLTKRAIRMTRPITMGHLRHLVRLTVPSALWLNGDLVLPATIRHLQVSQVVPDDLSLLRNCLHSQQFLRNNLRSINIGYGFGEPPVEPLGKKPSRKASRQLKLPSLCRIEMRCFSVAEMTAFFMHLFCPSLESAELYLDPEQYPPAEMEQMAPGADTLESRVPASDVAHAALQYPELKSLIIRVSSNWQMSYCLRMFPAATVQKLSLSQYEYDGQHELAPDCELGKHFSSALSQFHPRSLDLDYPSSFPGAWSIMCWMDTCLIETLDIHIQDPSEEDDRELAADQGISMFNLTNLTFRGIGRHLTRFMNHLEADHLVMLRVYTSEVEVQKINPADLVWDTIKSFCDTLHPTDKGIVPFPRLTDLYVFCEARKRERQYDNQKGINVDKDSLAVRLHELVVDILADRVLSGALPLHLTRPVQLTGETARVKASVAFEAHSDPKP